MSITRRIGKVLVLALVCVALSSALTTAGESTCYCVSGPDSASVCLGTRVFFSVTASGEGTLTYQWYHGSTPLSNGGDISGATSDQLQISNVESADAGEYTVTVTGARGKVTSTAVRLTVNAPTVITDHPDDASVCPGTTVGFSVTASGEGTLTYQWYHGSTPLSNGGDISGATSDQLQISNVESADAGEYTVTVTGECGEVTSTAVRLTVNAPTVITDHPDDASVCPGTTVGFSVTASGEGTLTYQWYHGSTPLSNGGDISGATSDQLQISNVESADAGKYTVTVTGECGEVTSTAVRLTVNAPTVITDHPDDASVCPGTTVGFSVTASGEGTLTYQWYHGSTPLSNGGDISGATSDQLQISNVESADAGEYTVTVTGECGEVTSTAVRLTVNAPTVITDHPDDASVCPGTTVGFSVTASGEGTLTYQWYHGSTPLSNGGDISGATSDQLQISNVESADAGEYTVTVTGECGEVTSTAVTLTVKAPTVITDHPDDASVCPGTTVGFSVTASGEGTLTYQWYHGSTPLSNGGDISGATSDQLQISNVESADAGEYTVTVTGECGEVTSTAVRLTVKAPTVITGQPDSVTVYAGTNVSFLVAVSGEGTLTYQWYHGSTPLSNGGDISGATSDQLQISNVESADAGEYTVTVTGECGEVTSTAATLAVRPAIGRLHVVRATELPKDILLVLDLSGSMEESTKGEIKIVQAKVALRQFFEMLPREVSVGLRTFHLCGHSNLEVPIQPISEGQILATLEGLETYGTTPLAYTLRQIPSDLEGLEGPIVIVFVTDGMETCKEDPIAAASELAASGLDIIFLLVGFSIDSAGTRARVQLQAIADAAGGRYTDVSTGAELLSAFNLVLPSFRVYDGSGKLVKEGIVGEAPFELRAGTYSVAVETDPQLLFEDVVIEPDETVTITVPSD